MQETTSLTPIEEVSKELDVPALRTKLAVIEKKMLEHPQLEIKITHHFSKGVYAREMFMPKGTILIGKIHKYKNLNIMSAGDVAMLSIDGVTRVQAPYTLVASPGAKRLFYAHEDTIWTCIHGTDETDLEKIEQEFIAVSYDEIDNVISEEDFKKLREVKPCRG